MAQGATIYRFRLEINDVDRNVFVADDIRLACQPSESTDYLISRVLAYALNHGPMLSFGVGLCAPEQPAMEAMDEVGNRSLWVDIGNPSATRIARACRAAALVRIYTYKDHRAIQRQIRTARLDSSKALEIFSMPQGLLSGLADCLKRNNEWQITHAEGTLFVSADDAVFEGEIMSHDPFAGDEGA